MFQRHLAHLALLFALAFVSACSSTTSEPQTPATAASPQQRIVDRSAEAVQRMRASGHFTALDYYLTHAEGVLVFPRLIKAGLVVGGEGGNGVLVAKRPDGSLSAPAFYSIGSGSIGLQIGYQEATVVLFFMNRAALMSAIDRGLTLGADASIAAGTVGASGAGSSVAAAKDIYYLVDVGGVFAGFSVDGSVIAARPSFNQAYYGGSASTRDILLSSKFNPPSAKPLADALAPHGASR